MPGVLFVGVLESCWLCLLLFCVIDWCRLVSENRRYRGVQLLLLLLPC